MKLDERCTWRDDIDGYSDVGLRKGITEGDAFRRLADYEDTGLSPTEIDNLLDLIQKERDSCSDIVSVYLDQILDMITDINPSEIACHIAENELSKWCDTWQSNIIMLFIKVRHYYEEVNE